MKTINCIKALEKWKRAKPHRCWDLTSTYNSRHFSVSLLDLNRDGLDKVCLYLTLHAALNAAVKYLTEERRKENEN